ncbi:hypothetical protein TIFTF001_017950 [Ficus carica]|uniref:Gnk2-homologous domain-containing protein n=1 Tax=Ficus carica TaxID=3494 RepID=A0AA88DAA4_FICCA|nr:hypothetical protein TIFTF001_017950 [Ficus carica]
MKFASLIIMGILCTPTMVISTPDTNVTTVLCNTSMYSGGDPFATSLAYVLVELQTTTPTRENYSIVFVPILMQKHTCTVLVTKISLVWTARCVSALRRLSWKDYVKARKGLEPCFMIVQLANLIKNTQPLIKRTKLERERERERSEMSIHMKFASLIIMGFLCNPTMVISTPNTNVTTVLCNTGTYTGGDPFATSLAYVLDDLLTNTPTRKNCDFYNISPYPNAFAHGHGSCNKNLTSLDCAACLGAAKTAMGGQCQSRIGARAVLYDCAIRYEQYPFTD